MEKLVLTLICICGLGIWAFFWGFSRLRRKRLIENIPTSTVRGLAMGLTELVGKAELKTPFKSPLTQRDCVFYRYVVERLQRSGRSNTWVVIARGDSSYCPFWLADETGRILVLPKKAELILPVDFAFTTGWMRPLPDNLLKFMRKHGIKQRSFLTYHTLRFREWNIRQDQKVYVLGTAARQRDSLDDHKQKLVRRLEQLKENPVKMAEVDLNKDGRISMEEWDLAVAKVEEELLEEELTSGQLEGPADVLITKGDEETMFIISDHSQKELIKKLFWQALLGIYGGAILGLVMIFLLLNLLRFRSVLEL